MPQPTRDERLAALVHELRNHVNTAIVAFSALRGGTVGFSGATAAALDRCLAGMRAATDRALVELRDSPETPDGLIDVATLILDVQVDVAMTLAGRPWGLTVRPVTPGMLVRPEGPLLRSIVTGLVRSAIEAAPRNADVILSAFPRNGRVLVEVEDECGSLPAGRRESDRLPFGKCGASLYMRQTLPRGCVITLDLPRAMAGK